jgi:N-methylhydantoinase A
LIPALAAVLSAFGVGFSDIQHDFEVTIGDGDLAGLEAQLLERARHAMFAEGVDLAECAIEVNEDAGVLKLRASKPVPRARLQGEFTGKPTIAVTPAGHRTIQLEELPLLDLTGLPAGAGGSGPIVLEDPYFTALVDAGWAFERSSAGDLLLTRS